jgi:hypothetical protein
MPTETETEVYRKLTGNRDSIEPKRRLSMTMPAGSLGEQATRDSVMMVVAAWSLLFLLAYSLRTHNI